MPPTTTRVRLGHNCACNREDLQGMALRALTDLGAVRPDAEILGVGAGHQATIFVLTNAVRRVFATDLYLDDSSSADGAPWTMLADPGAHWSGTWDPRRLVVQHMDSRELDYEDASFDGVFSPSSIERFGTVADVERALDEVCRVVKPGGVVSLSTELRLEDGPELYELIVGERDWHLSDALDLSVTDGTRREELMPVHLALVKDGG